MVSAGQTDECDEKEPATSNKQQATSTKQAVASDIARHFIAFHWVFAKII